MLRYGDMDNTTMIGVVGSPKTTTSSLDQCLSPPSSWSSLIYTIYPSFLHFFCWTPANSSNKSAEWRILRHWPNTVANMLPWFPGSMVCLSSCLCFVENQISVLIIRPTMPRRCFRHCLENGGTMGYCSRSPLSNPWTIGTYCEQLTLEDLKPIHFGEYLKHSKTSILTPKRMLKSVSRMVVPWYFPQSFQVSIFSIVWGGYYTNHETCWGNYDFTKWCLKGWILQMIQFQIAIQKTERPTNRNHYGSVAISM